MKDERKDIHECGCETEHEHECGCGCESVHEYEYEEGELPTILLTFDGDDEEVECGILGLFDFEDRSYIALLVPSNEDEDEDEEEEEVYLYRYSEDDDEQPILDMIEDDDEYERVAEEFERLNEEEFDEE